MLRSNRWSLFNSSENDFFLKAIDTPERHWVMHLQYKPDDMTSGSEPLKSSFCMY